MNLSDKALIQHCLNGDHRACNELVRRFQGLVYGMCYNYTRNETDAQDLAQESLIRIFGHLGQLRDVELLPGWIRQVTARVCMRRVQQQKRHKLEGTDLSEVEQTVADSTPTQADRFVQQKIRNSVQQAILELPEDLRLVVTLHYITDLSYRNHRPADTGRPPGLCGSGTA